jgi:hypothetical protein
MTVTEEPTTTQILPADRTAGWEPIARFATPEQAARGVTHLLELHHGTDDIAIAPARTEPGSDPNRHGAVTCSCRVAARCAVIGTASGMLIDAVGLVSFLTTVVPLLVLAAVLGGLAGGLIAWMRQRRSNAWCEVPRQDQLRVTAYDVMAGRHAEIARHDLARWWDPEAPTIVREGRT